MCPARTKLENRRGWIIPVGGGEKKVRTSTIIQRFVELSGGPDVRMAIIPTASQRCDAGARAERVFRELGVLDIDSPSLDRFSADDQEGIEQLCRTYCELQAGRDNFI